MFKTVRSSRGIPPLEIAQKFGLSEKAKIAFVKKFYEALGTPVALSCWLQYEAGEFSDLVSRELDPSDYLDGEKFKSDFAAISFLRKSEFVKTTFDKAAASLKKFEEAEEACKRTNARLRNLINDPTYLGVNSSLLHAMTRKIERILGEFSVTEFFDSGAWGPGSTALIKRDTSAVRKFCEERTITRSLYDLVGPSLEAAYPMWYRDGLLKDPLFVEFSKVITVPKNAKIDRVIAVEPGLNTWFQKAIGQMIKARLCRNGLNLKGSKRILRYTKSPAGITLVSQYVLEESQVVNGIRAYQGSQGHGLCTVDFSSASDMIAYELCRLILPPKWFSVMRLCRTARYRMPGTEATSREEPRIFHKFSSMGNGFTFELESLIFYTAALACCEACNQPTETVSVFGDDVVIPEKAYGLFTSFTAFLGFEVNPKKSFSSGPFRESCGRYYFGGLDVKPLYYKKEVCGTFEVYNMMNRIKVLSHDAIRGGCDGRFKKVWEFLLYSLPKDLRVLGTIEGGQGCIWSDFDQAHPSLLRHRRLCEQWEGFSFPCYTFPAVMLDTDAPGLLLSRLHSPSTLREEGNSYSMRDRTAPRKSRVSVQQWYNFGPWLD